MKNDLDKKYREWRNSKHGENVYLIVVFNAKRLLRSGHKRYSIRGILEYMRFRCIVEGKDDGFKINNNRSSRLAREIMDKEPALRGFFRVRELRG